MNCGQQFGQQIAFWNGFLLRAFSFGVDWCTNVQHHILGQKQKISAVKSFDSTADIVQMVGVSAPLQQPTGLLQPGGTQSAGQGLFESYLAKLAIKTENSTPQGAAFGADGGSRTHATVSCPKAFRVDLRKGNMVIPKADTGWFVRWFWAMFVEKTLINQQKIM